MPILFQVLAMLVIDCSVRSNFLEIRPPNNSYVFGGFLFVKITSLMKKIIKMGKRIDLLTVYKIVQLFENSSVRGTIAEIMTR